MEPPVLEVQFSNRTTKCIVLCNAEKQRLRQEYQLGAVVER